MLKLDIVNNNRKTLHVNKSILRIICFVALGSMLLVVLDRLFLQKWFYPIEMGDTNGRVITGFYDEKHELDVVFAGPSSIQYSISPLELYEKYNIYGYNLATSGQPIEATYYLLKEIIKTNKPTIYCLDAGALYSDVAANRWQIVLDQMPLSINKYDLATEYEKKYGISRWIVLSPLLMYHERWDESDKDDFANINPGKPLYSKGFAMGAYTKALDEDYYIGIENTKSIMAEYQNGYTHYFENGVVRETFQTIDFYQNQILDEKKEWLIKIKELKLLYPNFKLILLNDLVQLLNYKSLNCIRKICNN